MDRRLIKFDTCAKPAQVFFMAARGSKDMLTRAQNKVEHLLRDYQYPAMKEHISKLYDYFFAFTGKVFDDEIASVSWRNWIVFS